MSRTAAPAPKSHPPTSPNTAPAMQNECHQWSASEMWRHFQCAEQAKSPSNLTKYCACQKIFRRSFTELLLLLNCYFTELWLYWSVTWLKRYFTELLLYWTVTWLKCYFPEVLLYWTVTLRSCYFTELLLYGAVTLLNCYFTELLLYWTVTLRYWTVTLLNSEHF